MFQFCSSLSQQKPRLAADSTRGLAGSAWVSGNA